MGIYFRIAASLLIFALSFSSHSAVRTTYKPSAKSVISDARTGAVTTPYGEVEFYGPEKVYELRFNPGDSVGPTVRPSPTSSVGTPQFPYGGGAALPKETASVTKVAIKPKVKVPKKNILAGLKKGLKLNPGSLAFQAATAAALAGVGWIMDEGVKSPTKGEIVKPVPGQPAPLSSYSWVASGALGSKTSSSPMLAFKLLAESYCSADWIDCEVRNYQKKSDSQYEAYVFRRSAYSQTNTQEWGMSASRKGSCPSGYTVQPTGDCTSDQVGYAPVTDSDYSAMDSFLNSQGADWLSGLIREICNGSNNPGSCYEEMKSGGGLQGPSSVQGPSSKKTTAYLKPDGSTGVRTTETSTKFDLSYGDDHFDINTKTTSKTTEDGKVTSEETTEDTSPAPQIPDSPETQEPKDPEYSFSDSEFPDVKPFYDQKYPDGFSGVWKSKKAEIDNGPFMKFLSGFVPGFSGSCPTFGLDFNISTWANFGHVDFMSLCWVFDFIKVIMMVTTLFTCRALIFGG